MADDTLLQPPGYQTWVGMVREQILRHIQQNAPLYLSESKARRFGDVIVTNQPRPKRYTVIFTLALRAQDGTCLKRLIAKSYHLIPGRGAKLNDQELASKCEREFLEHQQVHRFFKTQPREFSVVQPLAHLPASQSLVIERAKGKDLATLIHQAKHRVMRHGHERRRLGLHFQRAGKWLAIFHGGFTQENDVRFEAGKFVAQIQWCVERMAKAGVAQQHLQALTEKFKTAAAKFQDHPLPQTQLHGDLKPCHLFVTKRRIIGIDFGNTTVGCAYEDVARMLAEIKLFDLGWDASRRGRLTDDLQNHFVSGYLGEATWPPLLRLYYAYWLCAKWTRRLYKHRWMSHALVKKADFLIHPVAVKGFVNRKLISPWFSAQLAHVLDTLESDKA